MPSTATRTASPVQPRVRGERVTTGASLMATSGSAPRARERVRARPRGQRDVGSAPRARGEGDVGGEALADARFSPACAGRGGLRRSERPGVAVQPACAGRGSSCRRPRGRAPVQPRVRGERAEASGDDAEGAGSAPRARGEGQVVGGETSSSRFSPACAGRGSSSARPALKTSVQPRVRGERWDGLDFGHFGHGSAPRARGEARRAVAFQDLVRFSPACAGRGPRAVKARRASAVQPRVRGERITYPSAGSPTSGSAPRARGEVERDEGDEGRGRFSPACAGRGPTARRPPSRRSVQPRVRGERGCLHARLRRGLGSAPRARGEGGRGS